MQELDNYVIKRIKTQLKDTTKEYVVITLAVTFSCGCCSEDRIYSSFSEDLLGKTDEDLLYDFEMSTEICLDHAKNWYLHDEDLIHIDE